jgi:AcrR family transcriptional regulator
VFDAELERDPPRSAKGARTRARLVAAARTVFERDGYLETRLTDITAEAGVATGSFYTYFAGKEDIFGAVLDGVTEEMLHPSMEHVDSDDPPSVVIAAANRAYLEAYERNAKLMRLLEEVATISPQVLELRRQRGAAFNSRNARGIHRLQARGVVDPELDPLMAARALSAMVSRLAYIAYVIEPGLWDTGELADTVTKLWVNALQLTDPPVRAEAAGGER